MRKNKFDSSYRYNPLNPRNWTLLCKINVITSVMLLVDWILVINLEITNSFQIVFYLICILIILFLSPFLNKDLNNTPFFIVMIIKIIIYLGISPYTFLGIIGRWLLNLGCGFVIGFVLFFMIVLEDEEPISFEKAMLIGVGIVGAHFAIRFIMVSEWRIEETWAILYIIIALVGIFIIQKGKLLTGGLTVFIITILNDYIVSFGLSGFGTGSLILILSSLFLVIYYLLSR